MADENPAWAQLEPASTIKGRGRENGYAPGEHEIELSKAISLKRIADALDLTARLPELALAHATGNAIADVINQGIRDGLNTPLNQYGEGIGEAISGQLERSQR